MSEPMTLQQIADELGISKVMVRKIEQRALRKARALLEQGGVSLRELLTETDTYTVAEPKKGVDNGEG